ncbi:MAG: ParB N-terminal domain-containing protein [Planctomycetota bacterium]
MNAIASCASTAIKNDDSRQRTQASSTLIAGKRRVSACLIAKLGDHRCAVIQAEVERVRMTVSVTTRSALRIGR